MILAELTGNWAPGYGAEIDKMFVRLELDLDMFRALLNDNPHLPESVGESDIPIIWKGLCMTAGSALPLGYCAMLTGRVLEMAARI